MDCHLFAVNFASGTLGSKDYSQSIFKHVHNAYLRPIVVFCTRKRTNWEEHHRLQFESQASASFSVVLSSHGDNNPSGRQRLAKSDTVQCTHSQLVRVLSSLKGTDLKINVCKEHRGHVL